MTIQDIDNKSTENIIKCELQQMPQKIEANQNIPIDDMEKICIKEQSDKILGM